MRGTTQSVGRGGSDRLTQFRAHAAGVPRKQQLSIAGDFQNRGGAVLWKLSLGTECDRVDGAIAGRQPHASAGTRRGAAATPTAPGENRRARGERRGTDEAWR